MRKELEVGNRWTQIMWCDKAGEAALKADYDWLIAHNDIREYMLVALKDDLNDPLPWTEDDVYRSLQ